MLRGLFSAASGMMSMIQAQEVITNNIANVATQGFKKDIPIYRSFSTILEREMEGKERQSRVENTFIDFTQGEIEPTGRALDLAIKGEGFFVLLTPQGPVYTRAGSFTIDEKGRLATNDGYFLLGAKQPLIYLPRSVESANLRVSPEGELMVDGNVVARIRVDVPRNPTSYLYKAGNNIFKVGRGGYAPLKESDYSIKQGYLELSNVNVVEEMADLLANFRLYEAAQKSVKLQNDTLEKICNQLA